jgi:hypothetical protein
VYDKNFRLNLHFLKAIPGSENEKNPQITRITQIQEIGTGIVHHDSVSEKLVIDRDVAFF